MKIISNHALFMELANSPSSKTSVYSEAHQWIFLTSLFLAPSSQASLGGELLTYWLCRSVLWQGTAHLLIGVCRSVFLQIFVWSVGVLRMDGLLMWVFSSLCLGPWLFSKLMKEGRNPKKQNDCVGFLICGATWRIVGQDSTGQEVTPHQIMTQVVVMMLKGWQFLCTPCVTGWPGRAI